MEGNECGNVLWYSYWRTHPHADPHIEKYMYNNSCINCGNDKKNQWFYYNQFGSCNSYRNYLKPKIIIQSNLQVFQRFCLSSYYYIFNNH